MSKQRLILAAGFAVLLLSVACLFSYARSRARFNEDAGGSLEVGMTLAEVEAIMGGPHGDYGYGEIMGWSSDGPSELCCFGETVLKPSVRTWTGQRWVRCVEFDEFQKAQRFGHHPVSRKADETWIAKARRFCGF